MKETKTMNGWKVLRKKRFSFNCVPNTNSINTGLTLFYPVGERVVPKIKDSKLYFFADKECARKFVSQYSNDEEIIVPCIAENPKKTSFIADWFYGEYWSLKKRHKSTGDLKLNAPEGSYCADAITCLE